jgi:hypothetical protein
LPGPRGDGLGDSLERASRPRRSQRALVGERVAAPGSCPKHRRPPHQARSWRGPSTAEDRMPWMLERCRQARPESRGLRRSRHSAPPRCEDPFPSYLLKRGDAETLERRYSSPSAGTLATTPSGSPGCNGTIAAEVGTANYVGVGVLPSERTLIREALQHRQLTGTQSVLQTRLSEN